MSYPFFSGYGRDEAFPQDTDLSPVPHVPCTADEKSMMVIRNGIAVVAYANYGQSGNIASENQLEIHDDLYTIEQHRADALNSNEPGIKLASAIYDEVIIKTLRSLPNCNFSH